MRLASASGTWVISGGSSTIRRPPRCSRVNRGRARSLVRLRARFADRLISARKVFSVAVSWSRSTSSRLYDRVSSGCSARNATSPR